jgi:aldose 1-epimerase
MPSIKKESFGKVVDGRETSVWTLRNTKGNELKVTDYGARVVSLRFRDKDFTNRFLFTDASTVLVDGKDFNEILWQGEQLFEGVKFTANINDKPVSIIYSLSNDNEISIRYESADEIDITAQLVFSEEVLPDIDFRACQKGAAWEKISDAKSYPVTEPAEVMMEVGMFGYDPGCPIDYLNAGLKNAANLFSGAASIEIIVYATQDNIDVQAVDGGFALKTGGKFDGKAQTVYMFKNRK